MSEHERTVEDRLAEVMRLYADHNGEAAILTPWDCLGAKAKAGWLRKAMFFAALAASQGLTIVDLPMPTDETPRASPCVVRRRASTAPPTDGVRRQSIRGDR